MAKKRETAPNIHIDDLHPRHDGFVQSYTATWQEAGIIATVWLEPVDRYHWQSGHSLANAYELSSHIRTVSGRPLGVLQEETGLLLLQALRAQMQAAMTDAGWQQVDSAREGRPIYQYRPGPGASGQDQPGLALAGAGAEGAGDNQVSEVERGDTPVITIDDLSEPPMTMARKLEHLDPRWYHAEAEQNGVKALITLRPYRDYHYPGGYIVDERMSRVDEFAWGHMGKKQEARVRALLDLLREQVQAALLAAGWERRWTTVQGNDLWLYVGTTDQPADIACESMPDITGVGTEGAGDDQVSESESTPASGEHHPVELASQNEDDQPGFRLEYQVELEPRHSHIVEVVGNTEAKGRGQQAAYSREVFTKPVTFTCIVCGETVTQQRYPGHTPLYCSEGCRETRQRERTRERVAKHRKEKQQQAAGNSSPQEQVTP